MLSNLQNITKQQLKQFFLDNTVILVSISYFLRTIFPLFKNVFIALLVISVFVIYYNGKLRWKFFKPLLSHFFVYLLLILFYVVAIFLDEGFYIKNYKEIFNALLIVYLFYLILNSTIHQKLILKIWFYSNFVIGILGLLIFSFSFLGLRLKYLEMLSEPNSIGIAFFSDNNIYALFFILTLLLYAYSLFVSEFNNSNIDYYFSLVFILNILLSNSRRGIFMFITIFFIFLIYSFITKNKPIKRMISIISIETTVLLVCLLIGFLSRNFIINDYSSKYSISRFFYRYSTIIDRNITFNQVDKFLWNDNYYTNIDSTNLINNGNFIFDLRNWATSDPKGTYQSIVETKYGKGLLLAVNRQVYWPLHYTGRPIYYHKELEYSITFKIKEIQQNARFSIGWWGEDKNRNRLNIKNEVKYLEDGWKELHYKCKFDTDFVASYTFLNTLRPNDTIIIADIRLYHNKIDTNCLDFVDQINVNLLYKDGDMLYSERVKRWKYAVELFSDYTIIQKLFGNGFDYLNKYGEKFYKNPLRLDYPHNPIISSFLYSGIIGGLFYIYFLLMVFCYYWKYRKHIMIFFLMYLVAFFFMMFSGNSHFSVPIFAFLSLIPFLTKYLITKREKQNSDELSNYSNNSNL